MGKKETRLSLAPSGVVEMIKSTCSKRVVSLQSTKSKSEISTEFEIPSTRDCERFMTVMRVAIPSQAAAAARAVAPAPIMSTSPLASIPCEARAWVIPDTSVVVAS